MLALLTFWARSCISVQSWGGEWGCSEHYRMFSSIPGLYPLGSCQYKVAFSSSKSWPSTVSPDSANCSLEEKKTHQVDIPVIYDHLYNGKNGVDEWGLIEERRLDPKWF